MKEYQSLCHTKWDCKYHVVFIPKKRKKMIFGAIRKHLGQVLHELAVQKECRIVEGHLKQDHVHLPSTHKAQSSLSLDTSIPKTGMLFIIASAQSTLLMRAHGQAGPKILFDFSQES